jgi:HD domain
LEVLEKREPLDADDWELIKEHTVVGERIVASIPALAEAAPLVRHSHENFDGSGYPDGLRGEQIPLGSRIIYCVDAFHAIRCDRPYREGRSTTAALREIKANAGRQFDPKVVKALAKSISSAHRPSRRRLPPRVATLFAALAIGSGGAYAAERGWVPSPIPGLGPDSASERQTDEAAANGVASSSSGGDSSRAGKTASTVSGRSQRRQNEGGDGSGAPGSAGEGDGKGPGPRGGGGRSGGSTSSSGTDANGGTLGGGPAGESGSATGQGGSAPGNVASAQDQGGPGAGGGGSISGDSGSAPGQTGSTPGLTGSTPGQSGSNPGSGGSPPGQSGSAPGQSGATPGQSGSAPGMSGSAPGHNKP